MKNLLLFLSALFAVSIAVADPYSIAKQQARNAVANENQAQQNIANAAAAGNNSNPALEATLQNIASLRADFANLALSPANQKQLNADLTAAAQGAKASGANVTQLAAQLATILAKHKDLAPFHQKLAQNIHAMFNSSHLSPAQQQTILNGVQTIFSDANVAVEDANSVLATLKSIAAETK